jgi:hypothetical protein
VLGVAPDPNDDDGKRRLLLPIKMNIGKLPEGIGYRIETASHSGVLRQVSEDDQPPVLRWDLDAVAVDATSAMDRNGTVTELGAVAEAKRALEQILANGRVLANECKRQLREGVGVTSETSLSRARKELGVRVRKEGFGSQSAWFWELASKDDARARVLTTPISLERMEGSVAFEALDALDSKGSNASVDIKDYKDSMDGYARNRRCRRCGRGPESHGEQDLAQCSWDEAS